MRPLRACLLSGGESRRMGRDKALLPHPKGGTWLERTLLLLGQLGAPVTLLSRHPAHLALAQRLGPLLPPISPLIEPPPCQGPLLALHRLMRQHPEERLLLCPVDMPELTLAALRSLLAAADHPAAAGSPTQLHLAHDGERLQPLLGVYPSSAPLCSHLAAAVQRGERRLQGWLATQTIHTVFLDPRAIRNVNRPEADHPTVSPANDPCSSTLLSQRPSPPSRSAPPTHGWEP
ncbi:MAG: molybdenum cofactor guanylyltransferase [Cyanobium sp. M30B3]|nr:MAG: molybdenum cofactor guanylyltransferase [Cyanobium sp. M30B3]